MKRKNMKKRKSGDVDEEGISERKRKVSSLVHERQNNNNKPSELVRTVKGLLQKEQTRLAGLRKLLNALNGSQNKESVESIVKEGGEFQEVFKILEEGRHNLSQLEIQTCLEILESILLFTAEESQLSTRTGMSIVQRVLQSHLSLLYSCLNPANPPEVIKSALRLLTAMVTQGASAAREVQRSFDFTLKSLSSLPNKRDSKSVQDVRTCFIYFCLSFLMFGDLAVMKQILELKGFLRSIMKSLQFDTPDVVHTVLSTLQGRVVQNSGITKKTKVQFFNSYVLSQLVTLYQYAKDAEKEENKDKDNKSDKTVRQKVHDLLLKICGSLKLGICFSNTAGAFAARSNNPVLLKFLQSLSSVTTDVFIQELVITVLSCCQDLVKPFLSSLTATYEPRLSMPWIANMNLVTKIYMALPQPSQMLEKSGLKMTAEMLPSLVNVVVPLGVSRTGLSRGVQHASSLVKHTTLSLLVVILKRAQNAAGYVASSLHHKNTASQSAEAPLLQQFREEVIKALPDVTTIIALRQNLVSGKTKAESQEEEIACPTVLLAQSLKVIHGFLILWPSVLSHVNFDLRKLLPGQQEMTLPPIVQQLTLQILLQAPPGSLRWYQQKGKSLTSFVYSVLNLYTSSRSEDIKNDAKQLLWKLLNEMGLVSSYPHGNEVEMWLGHLCHNQLYEGHRETLLRFLDEVFTAVAAEPYVYTDIVIDMQTEAVAEEASEVQFGMDSTEWNWSSDASLPVSLLLVAALKQYSQMVSKISESGGKAAVGSLGCIARYMNCVIFDMIHSALNPAILCFTVLHYYGSIELPDHLTVIRSLHKALLQYVNCWFLCPMQLQGVTDVLKESPTDSDKSLKELHHFLAKTTVNEKETALTDLYHHLESLDQLQLRTVIINCVDFCKHQLSEDFSPLVQVLQVNNYKIAGSTAPETIASLLQALPFSTLLWQVLGEVIQDANTTPNEVQLTSQPEMSSLENNTSSPLYNSWMQSLLMTALEKEPLLKTIPLCYHLLLYLRSLKTKLVIIANSDEQGRLQSAILLCFQLLQYLLQRLSVLHQDISKDKTNSVEEVQNAGHVYAVMDSYKPDKQELNHVEDACCTVLHHPVILNSFLWKPEHLPSCHASQDVGTELTYNVANLLLAVLPNLTLQQKKILMAPFIGKLCNDGMMEIQTALSGTAVPSSQALYLLGLFHDYCDKERQSEFISKLVQLPSNMLVTTDPVSKETAPSVFLVTLLMLLERESLGEEKLPRSSSAPFRDIPLKMEEPLSVSHFKQLIKISEDVDCTQLDSAILKLLQKSLLYVLASTTTLLDACLNKPTEIKVSIAAHLVLHSPALRSHFELCCLSTPNTKKKLKTQGKPFSTVLITFEDHLVEYLPVVSSYLLCIQGMSVETLDRTTTQAVVSHLVQTYWAPLWAWLVRDREGIFNHNEELCMELLTTLIHTMQRDGNLNKKLNELLTKASVWDSYHLRICHQLVTSICRDFSTSEQRVDAMSKFCFACMEFLSSVLRGIEDGDEPVIEDTLSHLESICKHAVTVSVVDEDCISKWNDFVTDCLRYKFESARVLRTLRFIIKTLYKEQDSNKSFSGELLSLETLYEMVLSHSQFLDVVLTTHGRTNTKEALAELMVTVVELNSNCCKSSHLPVLFAAYSASLSTTDQSILYLLNLYEKNHTSFKNYRPFLWGPAAAHHHQTTKSLGPSLWQQPSVSEVLEQMDASKMYQSAVLFPQSRLLQPQVQNELSAQTLQDVYDPCFLLPLFSCLLAPNFQVDCRKFVEQGCLSFTVASLSSRDVHVRQAGCHVLSRYMMHLEGARFKERKQIFHLLTCLKNSITEANCRISSLMVCFIARVVHILLKPEHIFYIMMNSFLLQRPALNLRDLPLFFTMFNSSSMQHVTERSWMLQLLADGMKDSPDYYLYKRRHVIELALSYHDSPVSDHHSRNLVTQLLLSALKIHPAAYDLTKNYGIVAWIHSLCYKSPGRLSTSLDLLQTLWFTLHTADKKSNDVNGEEKHAVRLPPNLAQECALVCWALLEQLRSCPVVANTYSYLQLLASVITYLAANEQPSGLSCDRILSLLSLWCGVFDETMMLNQLLSSYNLNEMLSSNVQTGATSEHNYNKLKTESLSSLLAILTSWQPSGAGTNQASLQQIVLLVWHFELMHCRYLSLFNKLDIDCPSNSGNQTPVCVLALLRWFRKCLVQDRALQDRLVTEGHASEVKLLMQLYQAGPSNKATTTLQHVEHYKRVENSRLAVTRELSMICLVLLAAAQRGKRKDIEEGLLQPAVCQLISQEAYGEVITKGLETVILPLLPDPCRDWEEESYRQDEDVVLQDLLSLLMQELWLEIPIPFQFLSYLLSQGDSGNPVVDSIILALGGSKTITKWIQKGV